MRNYEVVEVPYGWRVVEHNTKGSKFHARLYKTRADALGQVDKLANSLERTTAVADVRRRAQNRCECRGECGRDHPEARCRWLQGQGLPGMPGAVTLTVLPLDHDPDNLDPANLRMYCQICRQHHEAERLGCDPLFEIG